MNPRILTFVLVIDLGGCVVATDDVGANDSWLSASECPELCQLIYNSPGGMSKAGLDACKQSCTTESGYDPCDDYSSPSVCGEPDELIRVPQTPLPSPPPRQPRDEGDGPVWHASTRCDDLARRSCRPALGDAWGQCAMLSGYYVRMACFDAAIAAFDLCVAAYKMKHKCT